MNTDKPPRSFALASRLPPNAISQLGEHTFWSIQDTYNMHLALAQAKIGQRMGEVPVGAVLTCRNQVLGFGFNCPITRNDPTAHAEIQALRMAGQRLQNYRLPAHCTLYVTLEPCTMCVGALIHARLSRLVFAAYEPRAGMVASQDTLLDKSCYNHRIQVEHGLLAEPSSHLLKVFFKQRRQRKGAATLHK